MKMPKAGLICRGDPRICVTIILPNEQNESQYKICRRTSVASLEFLPSEEGYEEGKSETREVGIAAVVIPIVVMICFILGSAYALRVKRKSLRSSINRAGSLIRR